MEKNNIAQFPLDGTAIVGLPFRLHGTHLGVVIECVCTPRGQGLTIPTIDSAVECPHCHRVYCIGQLSWTVKDKQLNVFIGVDSSHMLQNALIHSSEGRQNGSQN